MKTLNVKNLFVGTMENESVITLDIKQTEENGVYSLEAYYKRCYIETEKVYDLESELLSYIEDAYHGYGTNYDVMRTVFDWLHEYDCAPTDLVSEILRDCDGNKHATQHIFESMGIEIDSDEYSDIAIAAVEHLEKNYYLIEDDEVDFDSYNVWGAKLAFPVFIKLFSLIELYNGKMYSESIATLIAETVEKCNADVEEHFRAYVEYTF